MSLLQPAYVPAVQFYPVRASTGPQRLALAVLEEAMTTYIRGGTAKKHQHSVKEAHEAARLWFASLDASYTFSFHNVCEVLGIDAGQIRTAVLSAGFSVPGRLLLQRVNHGRPAQVATRVYTKRRSAA